MTWPRTAASLCLLMLLGLAANAFMVWQDKLDRGQLETVLQPTAVGDHRLYDPPDDLEPGSVVARIDGDPVLAAGDELVEARDSMMLLLSEADGGALAIYRSTQEESGDGDLRGRYFVKVKRERYLPVELPPGL